MKAKLNDLVNSPSKEKLDDVKETPECQVPLNLYKEFKDKVRQCELGQNAKLWVKYIYLVWLLPKFMTATKENDLDLHIRSIEVFCSMFFSFDLHNCARCTTVYALTLLNLPETQPGADHLLKHPIFKNNCGYYNRTNH